jgi:hypothetical protein
MVEAEFLASQMFEQRGPRTSTERFAERSGYSYEVMLDHLGTTKSRMPPENSWAQPRSGLI